MADVHFRPIMPSSLSPWRVSRLFCDRRRAHVAWLRRLGIVAYATPPVLVHYEHPRPHPCRDVRDVRDGRTPARTTTRFSLVNCSGCLWWLRQHPNAHNEATGVDRAIREAGKAGAVFVEIWPRDAEPQPLPEPVPFRECLDHATVLLDEALSNGVAVGWLVVSTGDRRTSWVFDNPATARAIFSATVPMWSGA